LIFLLSSLAIVFYEFNDLVNYIMGSLSSENKLIEFLSELEKAEINYVVWKNIHMIDASIDGLFNIDLFIPLSQRGRFIEYSKKFNLIKADDSIINYPWISHFYGLGKSDQIFHLHVYFKIITGESLIKEYILPFDDLLLENKIKHYKYNIWIVNERINRYLFFLRHLLKNGSILSRLHYLRSLKSYKKEWESIGNGNIKDIEDLDFINSNLIQYSNLSNKHLFGLPRVLTSIRFRQRMNIFSRYNSLLISPYRCKLFLYRLVNKFTKKKKKMLINGGLILSFSGVDGSGKSSMAREISMMFSSTFNVSNYHIGKPHGDFIGNLWHIYKKKMNKMSKRNKEIKNNSSFISSLLSILIALLRFKLARKIINKASNGDLVIVDRWPTSYLGGMDGPRISVNNESNFLIKRLSEYESWLYKNFPRPDICIFFVVSLETALARNNYRNKKNKETQAQIIQRYFSNIDIRPKSKKLIEFVNDGDFINNKNKLIDIVWKEVCNHTI